MRVCNSVCMQWWRRAVTNVKVIRSRAGYVIPNIVTCICLRQLSLSNWYSVYFGACTFQKTKSIHSPGGFWFGGRLSAAAARRVLSSKHKANQRTRFYARLGPKTGRNDRRTERVQQFSQSCIILSVWVCVCNLQGPPPAPQQQTPPAGFR